ncbi:MAG: LptF/LptG family permease, partial [Elusimicrobiaceae bacterium]|nr:LptF/LptG family permease [Elusimicrobiaceae bacterium]
MSIISKYIAKKFWGPFLFILCIFCVLVFLADSIEKIRWINSYNTSLRMVLKYSLFTLPAWVVQLLPIACLLSGLLVITDMISTGEWTACLAGGFTVRQIFKPLLICIGIIAIFGFCVQEFVVPDFTKRAELTFQRKIKGKKDWYLNVQNDVTLRLDDRRILFAKQVKADAGLMEGMFIDIYGDDLALKEQIQAKRFVWDNEKRVWNFEDGILRKF